LKILFTNVKALASSIVFQILRKEDDVEIVEHVGPMSEDELIKMIVEIDAIVVDGRTCITEKVIESGRKLRIIARAGVGLDNIDVKAAEKRGIYVTCPRGANANAVAEHVIMMMMALSKRILRADQETRKGNYGFRDQFLNVELTGKTLGVIGFGAIGSRLALIASNGFNMQVLVFDPYVTDEYAERHNAKLVNLKEILAEADFISVNCALTEETRGLIGEEELNSMKKTAYLINTARGNIVNEKSLYKALSNGWIAGAGLDVFEQEPRLDPENPLFKLNNVVLSPHTATMTQEAMKNIGEAVAHSINARKIYEDQQAHN
jgi:D-3-phosphoglycerate dehydrogenase